MSEPELCFCGATDCRVCGRLQGYSECRACGRMGCEACAECSAWGDCASCDCGETRDE